MPYFDTVEMWIWKTTGRSLDQHAVSPMQAAADLPAAADELRDTRAQLLVEVDTLRSQLINTDDLDQPAETMTGSTNDLVTFAEFYERARIAIRNLIDDLDVNGAKAPAPNVRRFYMDPGEFVMVVLPHTTACLDLQVAGRAVPVMVTKNEAEFDRAELGDGQGGTPVRLPYAAAGIYRDPLDRRLYVLREAK